MKVFVYSLQREISQIISDHLSDSGHLCFSFDTMSDLSESLRSLNKMPDLLILDYLSFNHDIFNIHNYFYDAHIDVPVIFYNDPCLLRSTRASHWKAQLEITHTSYEEKDFSTYEPLFKALEELIESDELKPYISLLQSPKPLPTSLIKDKYTLQYLQENQNDCIHKFKERNNLPNNLFYLLTILQERKNISLSYNDIVEIYKKDGKQITKESLKVLMSKLKKVIHQDKECNFLIYHDDDRYKFVRYKI